MSKTMINTPKEFAKFVRQHNPRHLTGKALDVLYDYVMECRSDYHQASDTYWVEEYDVRHWYECRVEKDTDGQRIRTGNDEGIWLHVLGNRYLTYDF